MSKQSKNQKLKVGDVLICNWGYGQTNIEFYKIIDKTKLGVKIIPMDDEIIEWDENTWFGKKIPSKPKYGAKPMTRKIKQSQYSGEYISITSYSGAWKWDGEPATFDTNN